MNIKEGDSAPYFNLPSTEGFAINLNDMKGKWVVLFFYPKDETPGCTREACSFRDTYKDFRDMNVELLGVSIDGIKSHKKFKKNHSLPFPLLSDNEKKAVVEYGVMKEKSMFGKTFLGVNRSTFIIDPDGKIAKVFKSVKVNGHNDEVLEFLKSVVK